MFRAIELAFTGYPVTNIAAAREFYEGVLRLAPASVFEGEHGSWIEYEIGPGVLAISTMGSANWKPSSSGPCAALEVEDFDAAIAALRERRVRFSVEPFATPVCRMAVICDPDGNSLTIHKRNAG
ncbi:MAG TPA: VOC family protein [Urbifossiella sp.]|jgi:predicted enzyme related to lactoylglutathione lyase